MSFDIYILWKIAGKKTLAILKDNKLVCTKKKRKIWRGKYEVIAPNE